MNKTIEREYKIRIQDHTTDVMCLKNISMPVQHCVYFSLYSEYLDCKELVLMMILESSYVSFLSLFKDFS